MEYEIVDRKGKHIRHLCQEVVGRSVTCVKVGVYLFLSV